MDKRDQYELNKLIQQAPKDMIKRASEGKKRLDEFHETMKAITLRNMQKIEDPLKKKQIQHYMDNSVEETSYDADRRAERIVNDWWEAKLKKAFETGKLRRPDKKDQFRMYIESKTMKKK